MRKAVTNDKGLITSLTISAVQVVYDKAAKRSSCNHSRNVLSNVLRTRRDDKWLFISLRELVFEKTKHICTHLCLYSDHGQRVHDVAQFDELGRTTN